MVLLTKLRLLNSFIQNVNRKEEIITNFVGIKKFLSKAKILNCSIEWN